MPFTRLSLQIWEDIDLWLPYDNLYIKQVKQEGGYECSNFRRLNYNIHFQYIYSGYSSILMMTSPRHVEVDTDIGRFGQPAFVHNPRLHAFYTCHVLAGNSEKEEYCLRIHIREIREGFIGNTVDLGYHIIRTVAFGNMYFVSELDSFLLFESLLTDLLPKSDLFKICGLS